MLDCSECLELLDLLTPGELGEDVEVTQHLQACVECRQHWERLQQFDSAVKARLLSVPIPSGLQSRLLESLRQLDAANCEPVGDHERKLTSAGEAHAATGQRQVSEVAEESSARTEMPAPRPRLLSRRQWQALSAGSLVTAVLLAASFFWLSPRGPQAYEYAAVREGLAESFAQRSMVDWSEFEEFDHNFSIERLDGVLRKWQLTSPVGLDLARFSDLSGTAAPTEAHVAVAFQFRFRQWSGVLVAIPTSELSGSPQQAMPEAVSGATLLEWQSADGTFTFVCFVHRGSASDLVDATFGGLG